MAVGEKTGRGGHVMARGLHGVEEQAPRQYGKNTPRAHLRLCPAVRGYFAPVEVSRFLALAVRTQTQTEPPASTSSSRPHTIVS